LLENPGDEPEVTNLGDFRFIPRVFQQCIPRNCFTTGENGNYIWEGGRKMLLNSKLP
jgi:hypothetical protein